MKNLLGALAVVVLVMGTLAAAAYPSHPKSVLLMGEGSGPMPLCNPDDPNCDPGPMWPKPKPTASSGL